MPVNTHDYKDYRESIPRVYKFLLIIRSGYQRYPQKKGKIALVNPAHGNL